MLDHWHPVLKAGDVRRKPVAVRVAGQPIAVFRTASGGLGAVADACPHRRLKLSAGAVVGDRLRCKYHGWSFDTCGNGESPGTPKLTACATRFDVREGHGLIWVKARGADAPLPSFDVNGYFHLATLIHTMPAPLELTLDNFIELEHSATVHRTFGYDLDRMHEVAVRYEPTDTTLRVVTAGPTKRLGWLVSRFFGAYPGDLFHDDWTTHFSPVHNVVDHWWTSPDGAREGMIRWRLYIFFVPVDERTTRVVTVTYAKSRYPGPAGGLRLLRWRFRQELDAEIGADAELLGHLSSHDTGLDGMKLSRFDKGLGLARERLNRIYRGEGLSVPPLTAPGPLRPAA
jgi:phenylpropionate dioxygenase-like ring-hydroxylating dioxygenase large terminal subunit